MHAKYEVSISYGLKDIVKVKVDKQTDRQKTDRTKTICPQSFNPRALKLICLKFTSFSARPQSWHAAKCLFAIYGLLLLVIQPHNFMPL